MKKTNAVRLLDQRKIAYGIFPYACDEQHLSVQAIAEQLSIPSAHIYKTLVAKGNRSGIIVALVPGDRQLDYKALARLSDNKKIGLVAVKDLLPVTGYIKGGCSPIGMKKDFPVFMDDRALMLDHLWINGGQRGLLVKIDRSDLITITSATPGKISI